MRKFLLTALSVLLVAGLIIQLGLLRGIGIHPFFVIGQDDQPIESDRFTYAMSGDVKYRVKAQGNYFYFYENGKWTKIFLKGVNIGATKPGLFPGELSIGYDEYYRWFTQISQMNANCIRVYTAMRPQFYTALRDFNEQAENPLYLFQGVWMNEEDIASINDAYAQNEKIYSEFLDDAKNLVDVIHGNITLAERAGYASGSYSADVSQYFGGWMLGIEWDPKFVQNTNDNNQDRNTYEGKYMSTLSASPFETFLCGVGDQVAAYQADKYNFQVPITFSNWVTTDPLTHDNEPHEDEDLLSVNVENIQAGKALAAGLYACYHVYPYYPDSLNYQEEYIAYTDSTGKTNPYEAYLKDLKLAHTVPIVIAEFGIPTSRGMAHESVHLGYNQGHVDETRQGAMLADMMRSIYEEEYAGGIVFAWQDEWFKRTWNTVMFDVADERPFWSNTQTCEQGFGILTFDPGEEKSMCYVDGDPSEWADRSPIMTNDTGALYMTSDEKYVYFMLKTQNFDFDSDTMMIPIDTKPDQGNLSFSQHQATFDRYADFVILVNGKDNTRIVVDSYYDSFYYLYGEQYRMISRIADIRTKNSGRFNTMHLCYGYEMTLPKSGLIIPFKSYETGKLVFGNANPKANDYQSLADFCYKDRVLEIKIPWQLLNVMDPTSKQIMDDFYTMQSITPTNVSNFYVGMAVKPDAQSAISVTMSGIFTWNEWKLPTYHERLKPSYFILQESFKKFS